MAIEFPESPTLNDTFTEGSITYTYDGAKWIGLGVTPADRLVEGSNKLEIDGSNNLIWTGNNVGIGTTNPVGLLTIRKQIEVSAAISNTNSHLSLVSNGGGSSVVHQSVLHFGPTNASTNTSPAAISAIASGNTASDLAFYVNSNNNYSQTPNTEVLRITSSGVVRVGETTESSASTRLLVYEQSGNGQTIEVKAANTGGVGSQPGIRFTAPNNDNIGAVYGDVNSDSLQFSTGATERLRITSGGEVQIANGNLKFSTAGTGIDFSANANEAGMTSELLDDYEEGTWTPTLTGSSGGSGQVYGEQQGQYTKIGNLVTLRFNIALTTLGTFSGPYVLIAGFPFNVEGYSTGEGVNTVGGGLLYHVNLGTNIVAMGTQTLENNNRAYLWVKTTASTGREYATGGNLFSAATQLTGTISYQTTG